MKNFLLLLALLTAFCHPEGTSAQVIDLGTGGTTRAVVIGISDYQNLPDLQFAHRDAEAFAAFLQSPAGGSLPPENIRLLTNEKATGGPVNMELYWLLQESREGDQAIIYFSGHGDMEAKMLNQLGFLLCHDSPSFAYFSGGSVQVTNLQEIVSTLTSMNKTRVLLITDACRAGKLAGNPINGAGATTANLQQFSNAVKILSCQPTEFSLEGTEWGGGRGAFSYHLVNGLYGMADQNKDQQVKLREIDRYLDDLVPAQTAPQPQNPVVQGDKEALLAVVDTATLAAVEKRKKGELPTISLGGTRGFEEAIVAKADTNTQRTYQAFLAAIEQKHLMEPEGASANDYYALLIHEPSISQMHGMLTRNFVAALMDDAQQWVNKYLQSTVAFGEWNHPKGYGRYLARAAELLGEGHYLYGNIKGKEYFFKARDVFLERGGGGGGIDAIAEPFEQYLCQGLAYDDKAPYLYAHLAYRGLKSADKSDKLKAIEQLKKAIELVPSWVQANYIIGLIYNDLGQIKNCEEWIKNAEALDVEYKDPNIMGILGPYYYNNHLFQSYKRVSKKHGEAMERWKYFDETLDWKAHCYWCYGYLDKAETTYMEYIELVEKSGDEKAKINLGSTFYGPYSELGCINIVQGDMEAAEYWFEKRDNKDDFQNRDSLGVWNGWGYGLKIWLAYTKGEFDFVDSLIAVNGSKVYLNYFIEDLLFLVAMYDQVDYAIFCLDKSRQHYPDAPPLHYHLARLYLEQKNDYEKGVPMLERAVQLDSTHAYAHYHLAAAYAHLGKKEAALDYLEKALALGYDDPEGIADDVRWERLRGTKRYRELVKRYFPEEGK